MLHRHINQSSVLTAAVIDDFIERGNLEDWIELRDAAAGDAAVREKIEKICSARCNDPYAQRYYLWRNYVKKINNANNA